MNTNRLILIFVLLFGMMASRCTKEQHPRMVYTGVVVYNVCGNAVIQTTGPEHLGADSWTDNNNESRPVYKHVFTVANPCEMGVLNTGDTIRFTLSGPHAADCNSCMMYLETPAVKYSIERERN